MRSAALLALAIPVLSTACTLRYAQTSHADEALNDAKGLAIEGGVYVWDGTVVGQKADVSLMGSYQTFDLFTDAAASHFEGRLRWFPLEIGAVDPFVGGGFGIYRLNRTERLQTCRGSGICLSDQSEMRGQATGLSPHVVVGTEVGLGQSPMGLVLAVTREFGGFDAEWNLDAWRMSAGLSYRPGRSE